MFQDYTRENPLLKRTPNHLSFRGFPKKSISNLYSENAMKEKLLFVASPLAIAMKKTVIAGIGKCFGQKRKTKIRNLKWCLKPNSFKLEGRK
jgi:hypothetical protein